MAFGEVGWGADPGQGRCRDGETRPGESAAADGSAWVERGAGDGWTRGFSPWDPAAQASSCPAARHRASSAAPHPSGKSIFPSNSPRNCHIPSQVPSRGFNPSFPSLAAGHCCPSWWFCASQEVSLPLFFFFLLFASVWKIIIPQKAIHTTKAQ